MEDGKWDAPQFLPLHRITPLALRSSKPGVIALCAANPSAPGHASLCPGHPPLRSPISAPLRETFPLRRTAGKPDSGTQPPRRLVLRGNTAEALEEKRGTPSANFAQLEQPLPRRVCGTRCGRNADSDYADTSADQAAASASARCTPMFRRFALSLQFL